MLRNRSVAFKQFKDLEQEKDKRSMDKICSNDQNDFMLQAQQKFLVKYMQKNPQWRSLLLYHAIGSGKTCSSISMAEEYIKTKPNGRVTVILPARLRTNYFDELVSPCGMNAYISREDFEKYHNSNTSENEKRRIRTKFMKAIETKYEVISYEKMRNLIKTFPSLKEWAKYLTKDRMLIFDEVHNLLNDKFKNEVLEEASKTHKVPPNTQGVLTLLFKYLTKHAAPSCKIVMMTATPIFDHIGQLKSLLYSLNPNYDGPTDSLSEVIEGYRGKVSYFPGTSLNAYPKSSFKTHDVPLSNTQDKLTYKLSFEDEDADDEGKKGEEAFMSKQRQISLSCFPKSDTRRKNLKEYAPKVAKFLKYIDEPGKHLVYSSFIDKGLYVVRDALKRLGWVDLMEDDSGSDYKSFAIWDGKLKDSDKERLKKLANSKDNIDGKNVRIILGSPSIKEGISFKHIQHLHLLDPVWNQSSKSQIEGRAIRFCSHVDIPKKHSVLKRSVVIHLYKSVPNIVGRKLVEETCDQTIYDRIIPQKYQHVLKAEEALKRVALDYHLFKKLYKDSPVSIPPSPTGEDSPLDHGEELFIKRVKTRKPKNTCPKPRRPPCPEGQEERPNTHGNDCCFKKPKGISKKKTSPRKQSQPTVTQTIKNTCPKPRRPDLEGNCPSGQVKRPNKQGYDCCYKN